MSPQIERTRNLSNFAFLRSEWPALFDEAARAEHSGVGDPRTSCFYARRCVEVAVAWLYQADGTLTQPYRDDLSARLAEPSFRRLVGGDIQNKMDLIRRQGNMAVHKTKPVLPSDSMPILGQLFQALYWLARNYTRNPLNLPADGLQFDPQQVPRPVPASVKLQRQAELELRARKLAEQDQALAKSREDNAALAAEIAALQAQIKVTKAANQARPDTHDYKESETRATHIDVYLKEAGWALDQPRDREFKVTGMPGKAGTGSTGAGFVDYVLWGEDGKPLGLVEAKRSRRDPRAGEQQAKLYADRLESAFGQRPIIFYTNGEETWLWDDLSAPPRRVQGFYTRDELALLISRRTSRRALADTVIDADIVGRDYQQRAIRRIGEAFEVNHQRQALVVMATGAGKTRTAIALVDVLMRANWVKRVLFLSDRVALVTQAVNAFKRHLPDATTVNLVTDRDTDGRVYVSTYPTMMGLINESIKQDRFGAGYFDLVIIDEAHRSVYQKYKAIFSWFDSVLVGLTATPKDDVDHNTYSLFHLEDGVPTDAYSLDEAVAAKYLVPPRAVKVPLKFLDRGIRYEDLSEEERDRWDTLEWDEDGEVPDAVSADAVNRWLFNTDTVDKMLKTLMTAGHRVAGGDRLGKTIIFAKNDNHAKFIKERFDTNYPEYRGAFARVITYSIEHAQGLIDDLSITEKEPHIAISVDMLDTGIDVPDVVNLVFFKVVRSKTKFWQMVGRGTRLRPDLYGPGQDKQDFFIFDFCGNLDFFNAHPDVTDGRVAQSLSGRLFKARVELLTAIPATADLAWGSTDQPIELGHGTTSEAGLRVDVAHSLQNIVMGMNLDNFVVRPQRRLVETYFDLGAWQVLTAADGPDVAESLSDLPSSVRDSDEQAKRFDLLVLHLQLSVLGAEPNFDRLREQVRQLATALLELMNIPQVKAQQNLLEDVAGDEWWVDVTLPMLELLRRRVRSLVALIEKSKRLVVYTDFVDELGDAIEVTVSGLSIGADLERFAAKARAYLRTHEDHLALQKVRRNKPLSTVDLAELERMLIESGVGSPEDFARATEQAHGLVLFVRQLVGLDQEAANEALSGFISGRTLSANQLDFLGLVVSYLTQHGVMAVDALYESPFTELAPTGPDYLFSGADIEELVGALNAVRATTQAVDSVA